jgi:hypothetical protein
MARLSKQQYHERDQRRVYELFKFTGKCDPPIDKWLQIATEFNYAVRLTHMLNGETVELRLADSNIDSLRACVAHWLIKLRLNKNRKKIYKHPWGKDAELFRPLADVYIAVWDAISDLMDTRCHIPIYGDYETTYEWFCSILYEFRLVYSSADSKKAILAELQKTNRLLTDIKNGIKKGNELECIARICNPEKSPHTFAFWVSAFKSNPDGFESVLKLMKEFATHFDKNIDPDNIIYSKEDCDFLRESRGKGIRKVLIELASLETLAMKAS